MDCDSTDLVYLDCCCTIEVLFDRQRDNLTEINMVHSEKRYHTHGSDHAPCMSGAVARCASWRQVGKCEMQHRGQPSAYETMFRVPSKMRSPGNIKNTAGTYALKLLWSWAGRLERVEFKFS